MNESQQATIREQQAHLLRVIEAIQDVQKTTAWSTLKEEFDSEIQRLNRLLLAESKKPEINLPELYRYQGRIEEAKRISLEKLLIDSMTDYDNLKRKL